MRHVQLGFLSLLGATTILIGCSDETLRPAGPRLEGNYAATDFTVVTPDTTFDELEDGVAITLTIQADGRTTGALTTQGSVVDLGGTWDTAGGIVRFQPVAPSFLAQMPFTVGQNQLRGILTQPFATLRVTLSK